MAAKTIFIVDDSEIVREMVGSALRGCGYEVQAAAKWEELDEVLGKVKPDLVLMDINMPEVFGDHALMYFKEERGLSQVPMLLFSDIEETEIEERARECGADGYVAKKWGVEKMVEVVRKYLKE